MRDRNPPTLDLPKSKTMTSHVPALVLHAGDIPEGADAEYHSYLVRIPSGLRDRIRHMPG
ncbi:hypothetical protein GCM10009670_26070 [Citricoccus alkalitolerans]